MKIFAITLVKNEIDIIQQCLEAASVWADKIFVYDNGSTDGTWELVQQMAGDKIVAWKQDPKPYEDWLRAEVFAEFKHLAQDGDWWCFKLDSDEFYVDDPRVFLPQIPGKYQVVAKESIEYVLTHEDLQEFDFSGDTPVDLSNIRYHMYDTYSEVRFFRHRKRLNWNLTDNMPRFMGITSPKRIKLKHFQYRSVSQLINRISMRVKAVKEGSQYWKHVSVEDWKHYLRNRSDADIRKDEGNNQWQVSAKTNDYLGTRSKYLIKRLLFGLKILP